MFIIKKINGWYSEEDPAVAEARTAAEKAGTHLVTDWRNTLDEQTAGDASLADFKDIGSLVKSYIHTKKMVGADKIVLPGEDAGEDEINAFFAKLGRPDGPDKYELGQPEKMPEGFRYNEQLEKDFRVEAHKFGLNKKQTAGLWNMLQGSAINAYSSITGKQKERLDGEAGALKTDWGEAYEDKIKAAQRTINALEAAGVKGLNEWLKESGAGSEPMIKRVFAAIAEHASEEQIGAGESSGALTPAEAQSKANAIRTDETNPLFKPYWEKKHIRHKEAVAEVMKLEGMTGEAT